MDKMAFLQAIIVGLITGVFSAGTIWGIFKTELRFMRRDLDEVRRYIWPTRRADDVKGGLVE